jgi:hypothetical protein
VLAGHGPEGGESIEHRPMDMTVMLLMDRLLGQPAGAHAVEYLDGLVAFEREGDQWLQSVHGPAVRVSIT